MTQTDRERPTEGDKRMRGPIVSNEMCIKDITIKLLMFPSYSAINPYRLQDEADDDNDDVDGSSLSHPMSLYNGWPHRSIHTIDWSLNMNICRCRLIFVLFIYYVCGPYPWWGELANLSEIKPMGNEALDAWHSRCLASRDVCLLFADPWKGFQAQFISMPNVCRQQQGNKI